MNEHWAKFIKKYKNIHFTKDAFDDLCRDLLDYYYTGKQIITLFEIDKANPEELQVIYLAKFFTENLANSRKSQIRREFAKFITKREENNLNVYRWVLCLPYSLNDEEMKWWLNWKEKQQHEHSVNISLFDGDFIIQNARKYDIYEKYFLEITEQQSKNDEDNEVIDIELIEDSEQEQNEAITQEQNDKVEEKELKQEEKIEKHIEVKEEKQEKEVDEVEKIQETEEEKIKQNIQPIEKEDYEKKIDELPFDYDKLKKEYHEIKEKHLKHLSNNEKSILKDLNPKINYLYLFEDEKFTKTDNEKKLFFFANAAKAHNYPDKALFYFEEIKRLKAYKNNLHLKKKEIYKNIKSSQAYLKALIYELQGDIYRMKKIVEEKKDEKNKQDLEDYIAKTIEFYELAYKSFAKNKEFNYKYFEFLGDYHTEKNEFKEAIENYEKALEIKKNKHLESKKNYAERLYKGEKAEKKFFKIFTAWWHYKKALKIFDKEIFKNNPYSKDHVKNTDMKFQRSFNRVVTVFSIFIVVLLLAFFLPPKTGQLANYKALKNRADKIVENYSPEKIHLIDTAIVLYNKILKEDSTNIEIIKKLKNAKNIKKEYIATAQKRIKNEPEKYFIAMRSPSEGLQLFKYLYDPQNKDKGKYGYVDKDKNIIIPPVYDFKPNEMYDQQENFHNGKAVVYLKTSNGKDLYLLIDKNNKVLKKLVTF